MMPQATDNKPPSPPPGFDPLPTKSMMYMKSGYSSHVLYPTPQSTSLFSPPYMTGPVPISSTSTSYHN